MPVKRKAKKTASKAKSKTKTKPKAKLVKNIATALAKTETEKRGRGRPTLYKPEYCAMAEKLCNLGATDVELADFFNINKDTLYGWMHRYPEFSDSIKTAKEVADERVERSLYAKATGYTFDEIKLFMHEGKVIEHKVRSQLPPDGLSMIFWLKNRRPDKWRDKQDVQHLHGHLDLPQGRMSPEKAQELFRELRSMTSAELSARFKLVDAKAENVTTAPVIEHQPSDQSEDAE